MEDTQAGLLFAVLGIFIFIIPLVGGLSLKWTKTTERFMPWILALISMSILTGLSCIVYSAYLIPDPAYSMDMTELLETGARTSHYRLKSWLFGTSFVLMIVWFSTVSLAVGNLVDHLPPTRAALNQLFTTMTLVMGQIVVFFNFYVGYLVTAAPLLRMDKLDGKLTGEMVFSWVVAAVPYAYPVVVSVVLGGLCIRKTKGQSKLLSSSLPLFFWSILLATLLALSEATTHLHLTQGMSSSVLMLHASQSGRPSESTAVDYVFGLVDKVLLWVCGVSTLAGILCAEMEVAAAPGLKPELSGADCEKQAGHIDAITIEEDVYVESQGPSTAEKHPWRRRKSWALSCCVVSAYLFAIGMVIYRPSAMQGTPQMPRTTPSAPEPAWTQWNHLLGVCVLFLLFMALGSIFIVAHMTTRFWYQDPGRSADEATGTTRRSDSLTEKQPLLESETGRTYGTWEEYGELSLPLDLHMPIQ